MHYKEAQNNFSLQSWSSFESDLINNDTEGRKIKRRKRGNTSMSFAKKEAQQFVNMGCRQ
jgi:hypothetical protein